MVYGEVLVASTILENGKILELMVKECMFGVMEISMRVTGEMGLNMEMDVIFLVMVMCMLDSISLENLMVKVSIHGKLVQCIMECS
jgi:hypothetical protein